MRYTIFKPRRALRNSVKNSEKKNIVLEDGELMIVRKESDNDTKKGVKSDIYIGNGVTKMENMKPAVYGDTSEEPITVTSDSSTTSQQALSNVVSNKPLASLIGSLKRAIEILKQEAIVPPFGPATASSSGTSGLVPAPDAGYQDYILTGSGWQNIVTKSTSAIYSDKSKNDVSNQQIDKTYIKNISVNGTTLTFTKGNNSASTVALQDNNTQYPLAFKQVSANTSTSTKQSTLTFTSYNANTSTVSVLNTTYANFTAPTASAAGKAGLVMAPAKNTMNYVLTASGWQSKVSAAVASDKSKNDNADQQIDTTYIKEITVNGTTLTYKKGNGSASTVALKDDNTQYPLAFKDVSKDGTTLTFTQYNGVTKSIQTQDTTYDPFGYASASAAGSQGLVPKPAKGQENYVLTGSGWKKSSGSASSAVYADNCSTAEYIGGLNTTSVNVMLDNVLMDFGDEG